LLRLIAAATATNHHELAAPQQARAWDAVAVEPYVNVARRRCTTAARTMPRPSGSHELVARGKQAR